MNDRLRNVMARILELDPDAINPDLKAADEPMWDSLKHMNLVFALEDEFGIRFSDAQLPRLTSVAAIEEALGQ